jgi:hypothetical protein
LAVNSNPDSQRQQAASQPGNDPFSTEIPRPRRWLASAVITGGMLTEALLIGTGSARAAWQEIAQFLSLQGKPALTIPWHGGTGTTPIMDIGRQ